LIFERLLPATFRHSLPERQPGIATVKRGLGSEARLKEETLKPCADLLSADRNGDLSIGFYQFVNLLFWKVFVRFKPIYLIIIEKVFLRFQLEGIVK
jgi:hypothetical protein